MRAAKQKPGWRIAGFIALAYVACLLLQRYIGSERTFYYWDYALYPNWAAEIHALWRSAGFGSVARVVLDSLNDDFSRLFTLPSALLASVTGEFTRPLYGVANFLAYGVTLALVLAAGLSRWTAQAYWRCAPALLLALLSYGFIWTSLVEGYPDLGGTVLLAGALVLTMHDWPRVALWRWLAAGALLALAILFRRHFIYPGAALLGTLGALQLWHHARARCWRFPDTKLPLGSGPALALLTAAAVLILLAPAFVERLFTMQYPALYQSYRENRLDLLDRDLLRVGALNLALALAGYVLAWRRRAEWRVWLPILPIYLLVWGLMWFAIVRFGGQHYLQQILPIVLPVGLVLLFAELAARRMMIARRVTAALLLLQALAGFWLGDLALPERHTQLAASRQWFNGVFAVTRPPMVRTDYDAINSLVGHLLAQAGPDDHIAVIASSQLFNQDVLLAALRQRASTENNAQLPLVMMPDIDRRDPLPLDAINRATMLVVATPPQYHLPPEGQRVVGSVLDLLTDDEEFLKAWTRDATLFQLMDGVTVSVWRLRRPWLPRERAEMLAKLRQRAAPSGSQPQDWVMQSGMLPLRALTAVGNRSLIAGAVLGRGPAAQSFFSLPLLAGRYQLAGRLRTGPDCPVQAQLSLSDGAGGAVETRPVTPGADGGFAESFARDGVSYLWLEFSAPSVPIGRACGFEISDLAVMIGR